MLSTCLNDVHRDHFFLLYSVIGGHLMHLLFSFFDDKMVDTQT